MGPDSLTNTLATLFEIDRHPLRQAAYEIDDTGDYAREAIEFEALSGETVNGIVTRPKAGGPFPAILYIHAHGDRYDIGARELLDGRPALQEALGPVLARSGFVTLAIDLPCFGGRATARESALSKAKLWRGRSLAGQMLGELSSALGWLAARPDVDARRVGAFGISMGATLGYWLAATDARLSCLAQLCCFADFDQLIEGGAHDLHGIYLTVPGLLEVASNGEIAGLVAPRPQLICIGDRDPLTPPRAVDPALASVRAAYAVAGATENLAILRQAEVGHQESPEMRAAVLAFFRRHLGSG
jgi:dienelactone hydrolase